MPDASFAGQQETFLNILGFENVMAAIKHVSPRCTTTAPFPTACNKGFAHDVVALSAGIQRMVRSDCGAAGVMFTIDTEPALTTWCSSPPRYGLAKPWCKAP